MKSSAKVSSTFLSAHRPVHTSTVFSNVFQRSFVLVLVTLFSPVFLLVAISIWRKDGSPILFHHYRVGHAGKLFKCLKFRTMYRDSPSILARHLELDVSAREEWARDQKLRCDPRITPIGRFLRRTSLDELPQLLNVLRGEMNLVGPRPIIVEELARYGCVRWGYLAVKPGITGLWQISGRNLVSYERRVALDKMYVEQRSFLLDAKILLLTVKVLITREGAG